MTFRKPDTTHPPFRVALEQNITRRLVRAHDDQQAPEWVVHRVVGGKEVLNRRTVKGAAWRFK